MKRNVIQKWATMGLMSMAVLTMVSCGGVKKTESGLEYQILKKGEGSRVPQKGDYIFGEMWIKSGDSVLFTNEGKSDIMMQVADPLFLGDLNEAMLLVKEGDRALFNINADSMRKFMPLPELFKDKVTYEMNIEKVMNEEEYQAWLDSKTIDAKKVEGEAIAKYIKENNITVSPLASGLYFIETAPGSGAIVQAGQKVKLNYVGRLLDGKLFDTSVKSVAEETGTFNPQRNYEPMEIIAGGNQVIPGMDEAILKMKKGGKATIIIPFELAYGERDLGSVPPYSTLVFDIEIVSVANVQ